MRSARDRPPLHRTPSLRPVLNPVSGPSRACDGPPKFPRHKAAAILHHALRAGCPGAHRFCSAPWCCQCRAARTGAGAYVSPAGRRPAARAGRRASRRHCVARACRATGVRSHGCRGGGAAAGRDASAAAMGASSASLKCRPRSASGGGAIGGPSIGTGWIAGGASSRPPLRASA